MCPVIKTTTATHFCSSDMRIQELDAFTEVAYVFNIPVVPNKRSEELAKPDYSSLGPENSISS